MYLCGVCVYVYVCFSPSHCINRGMVNWNAFFTFRVCVFLTCCLDELFYSSLKFPKYSMHSTYKVIGILNKIIHLVGLLVNFFAVMVNLVTCK